MTSALLLLEEMPRPVVPAVEGPRVTREEGAHAPGQWARFRADKQVKVIRQEGPGIHRERVGLDQCGQAADEVCPVLVIPEDDLPIQPPAHHVVEHPGGIEAGGARHGEWENSIR